MCPMNYLGHTYTEGVPLVYLEFECNWLYFIFTAKSGKCTTKSPHV
jgi:hypothetical protein